MRSTPALRCLLVLALAAAASGAPSARAADAKRWWLGDWADGYAHTRCTVRMEVARSQFRREIFCPDGAGARWGGEWTAEFRDGPCFVKQVATREKLVEEVECSVRR